MLNAAEDVLADKSFDDATLADIAGRAGVTIGAFYARFRDKDALLRQLEARMATSFVLEVDQAVGTERMTPAEFEHSIIEYHQALVGVYERSRGIGRALVLRSYSDPALRRRLDRLNQRNMPRLARFIARHGRIRHPGGEQAVRFALLTVRSVCREIILFRQSWPGARAVSSRELATELTRLLFGYLDISPSGR